MSVFNHIYDIVRKNADHLPNLVYDPTTDEVVWGPGVDSLEDPYAQGLPTADNDITGDGGRANVTAVLMQEEPRSLRQVARETGLQPSDVKQHIYGMRVVEEVPGEGYTLPEEVSESLKQFEAELRNIGAAD